jgi:hypothetical protein|tara:strand:+ start:2728 stop:3459 length:732 start_codon:yes stop_codon:yes gene_type:complete
MNKKEILKKLSNDEDYYGKFGKKYLSSSDVGTLLSNPLALGQEQKKTAAFLVGGYFHTTILEPDKLKKFKVIPTTTRNTKLYKEMSDGELCLLQHEVDMIEKMSEKMLSNKICKDLIQGDWIEYEKPMITKIGDYMWKGKCDVLSHGDKLVIDLKTTADINNFRRSAFRYNYDAQAYVYRKLFGYDMLFIVIDKTTHQIGMFDCSDDFYASGKDKVERAMEAYDLFFKSKDFDPKQYFISKTL